MLSRREIAALTFAFLLTLPAVTTRIYASDEAQYFAWLRSVVFDQDVDFENEYRRIYDSGMVRTDGFRQTFLERTNEAGRRINFAPVGSAILWAPFYAVGFLVALVTGQPLDGFSQPFIAAIAYASACYAFLAVLLGVAIARRLVGRGLEAALFVWLGTPLLFYMYVAPPMSHAASAFCVSLFVWVWLRARETWDLRAVVVLGAVGGLMAMVREQDLFFVIGPAVDFLARAVRNVPGDRRRAMALAAVVAAGVFLVAFTPQLFAYQSLNGHPGPTTLVARKMSWTSPHAAGVLLSTQHGLLAWTPMVAVALVGLVQLARGRVPRAHGDAGWIAGCMLLMVAVQVYIAGSVESWTVAGAFGQRRFVALTPLLVVGIAAVLSVYRAGQPRWALRAVLIVCVWWNLGLMVQFGTNRMDRQRLTLAENARTTFVELPAEMPGIAWRYFVDRRSFYRTP